ncbi:MULTISPECIES: transcription antitermination factor NusB [unclassified Psychrobacter]|jgi:16S rRNA (cytosine967-C5)-methyltransferase|uniref:transcription antitermination factor NusB n=1 Tax=unclassified Psychrobacter TaxID=196806 RepID=UPI00086E9F5E|nr:MULTISPECIES: transcription antitermination factor NusB [unclassified Psychrobacter]OEH67743.1 MAG: rRNA methyltransferase [Psychrobacter sp. B29-1]PKG64354.1 rRNA methyltransferase [Psychrobacter sp. Choline-02u-13]PKH53355.1 rRNA methyltransferase [Psychrobacter sp. Choline-02u-9]|tara:strand:+ start:37410 stop:39011 length:1602 start_codon:yes stop_codon:yes gene_type:complete
MRQNSTAPRNNKLKPSSNLIMNGSVRVRVIRTLLAIQNGQSLSSVLDPLLNSLHDGDKGFAHALLLTTLRQWHALARLLDSLADNPIDEVEVRTTIQVGLVQLLYLEVADHAAIHETVEAAKEIEFAHSTGLVNAILRKVAKNPSKFRKKCDKKHSLPNWLAYQLKQDWSEQYDELTQGLRQPAPMFLRVNSAVTSVEDYQHALDGAEIDADIVELTTGFKVANSSGSATSTTLSTKGLRLHQSTAVNALPDFALGTASVQDMHAQLAAPIINQALMAKLSVESKSADDTDSDSVGKEIHILDACAAPGGKLAHWLELISANDQSSLFHVKQDNNGMSSETSPENTNIKVTAIDNEAPRIERIRENLQRLNLSQHDLQQADNSIALNIVCADATRWQHGKNKKAATNEPVFDAILLDSPCTATGVIRRHPDISILRTEEDIEQTALLQADILHNLWPQLKAGGYLLYVTCSILKQENVEQMQDFITHHNDAVVIEFTDDCNWGIEQAIGRQCLPIDSASGDGFYYALLQKTAE